METWLQVKTLWWPAQAGAGKFRTRLKSCLDLWNRKNMIHPTGCHSAFSDSVLYKEDLFSCEDRWKGHHRRLSAAAKTSLPIKPKSGINKPLKCSTLHEINEENLFSLCLFCYCSRSLITRPSGWADIRGLPKGNYLSKTDSSKGKVLVSAAIELRHIAVTASLLHPLCNGREHVALQTREWSENQILFFASFEFTLLGSITLHLCVLYNSVRYRMSSASY